MDVAFSCGLLESTIGSHDATLTGRVETRVLIDVPQVNSCSQQEVEEGEHTTSSLP